MSYPIDDIEGIGVTYGHTLGEAGLKTTRDLLKLCCDRKGRKRVAARTGIPEKLLLKWANLADLMRINGIGPQFSELLEAAGVDTVKELRNCNAENLAEKMEQVNAKKHLTRRVPPAQTIEGWVEAAQQLDPMISH